jgi:phosphomevalonate kinase
MQVLRKNGLISCSAPGKILILGGYLVLFPNYSGVVLSAKPRIETTISAGTIPSQVGVMSKNLNTSYVFKSNTLRLDKRNNPYVEYALKTSLQAAECLKPTSHADLSVRDFSAHLEIVAHPSFYLGGKTGLGSSSAVVSSVVGCVLNHFGVTDLGAIHLVSQVAHSLAQNKVSPT